MRDHLIRRVPGQPCRKLGWTFIALLGVSSAGARPAAAAPPGPGHTFPTGEAAQSAHQTAEWKPRFLLSVQIVRTADDDGSSSSTLTQANGEAAIARANEVYRRNDGDVQFWLHRASNFGDVIRSTLLNRDCILAAGQTYATINANTDGDLNDDGVVADDADRDMLCDYTTPTTARIGYAVARGDRIIVFSRGGNDRVFWDKAAGHWRAEKAVSSSSARGYYVQMSPDFGGTNALAHEIGHYLHTAHTFASAPGSIAEARQMMEEWVQEHPGDDPRNRFDFDARVEFAVADTPPDPGTGLFRAVYGDICDPAKGSVTVPVQIGSEVTEYILTPDRELLMSYFSDCPGFNGYESKGEYEQIHRALKEGNRRGLVDLIAATCYTPGSDPAGLPTSTELLRRLIRKISACVRAYKRPLPWEMVQNSIYGNPEEKLAGFVRAGRIAVNRQREDRMLDEIVHAKMEE